MQLLSDRVVPGGWLLAVIGLTCLAMQASAHPPHESSHGVNRSTACTLWAGDEDVTNASEYEEPESGSVPELCTLAPLTDIPLDDPPAAVEQWNRGDHGRFPETGHERSAHLPNASLSGGRFVDAAHATIFTVQPSTRARLSETEQPLYVASKGTLLGVVDYRVDVPEGVDSYNKRVTWSVSDHEVNRTRVLVDGDQVTNASGNRTPALAYDLARVTGEDHELTLEADVFVELEKRIRTCGHRSHGGECLNWEVRTEYPTETHSVADSIDVTEYDLAVSGYRGRYPNGDLGLVVYRSEPWRGYSVPAGDVNGVWRFYSASDPAWDDLVRTGEDGVTSRSHSPVHPLQVTAYPIETGPTAGPHATVRILEAFGTETLPPTLPDPVELDVVAEPYTASFGIATRTVTDDHSLDGVTATGLVRGVTATASEETFIDVPINETTLSIDVRNRSRDTITVRATLRDNGSGERLATADRPGSLVVAGQRVNTTRTGTVTVTVPRDGSGVSARFEPGHWWDATPGYVRSSDVVYVGGSDLAFIGVLFQFGLPASLFLLAVFVIDRTTGWRLWPPWRLR